MDQSSEPARNNARAPTFTLDSRTVLIALVALTGGGNLWFTKVAGDQSTEEAAGTTRQIAEMHATLSQFKNRIDEIDRRWDNMDVRSEEVLEIARRLDDRTESWKVTPTE
jgi:hypothetical protein